MSMKVLQSWLEFYFKEIEIQLDSAFNNINYQIDSLFNMDSSIYNVSSPQLGLSDQNITEISLIDLSEYYSDLFHLVKPQIISKIKDHVQLQVLQVQNKSHQYYRIRIIDEILIFKKPFTYQFIKEKSTSQDLSIQQLLQFGLLKAILKQISIIHQHKIAYLLLC
ncbi:unnamed protein product [Paramecium octaurelia]|uniref:Uncharacterized protein n=1 Tax=Paramecium octaurelia TaxID=43137 RepID=A0A8S1YCT5_PAROT|nr:unnamed protein product [Paramecium octaurelia]CAD8211010.1 unnamed protein product [Paramecium octaurelia]